MLRLGQSDPAASDFDQQVVEETASLLRNGFSHFVSMPGHAALLELRDPSCGLNEETRTNL